MKWNFRKIVIAATVIPIGALCIAAEITSEENEIIDMIVNTNIKKINAEAEILKAIAKTFRLSTEETPESTAFIKQLEAETLKKYPATDKELETKYRAEAEKNYPSYKIGDSITVIFRLHGKPFTVSGPYYRQDPKFVWVGSKKILKAHLSKQHASGFDPKLVKKLRDEFVEQNIRRYNQEKKAFFSDLKAKKAYKINELRGNLEAYEKLTAAKKAAIEKYRELVQTRTNKFKAAQQMYAKDKIKAYDMMKKAIKEYAGTPEAAEGINILSKWEKAIVKEKQEREESKKRYDAWLKWREEVRNRTGHYPCNACEGRGRTGFRHYDRRTETWIEPDICNACGGTGLAD